MSFETLYEEKKLIACVGTGGVGKTTTAAALAIDAARSGKRVLVITVDPSQRLASTLGLDRNSSQVTEVKDSRFKGQLFGVVVCASEIFDQFLAESSSNEGDTEKLSQNRLFKQLKTRLSGSQDFTALELLYRSVQQDYDLIVLDTPPAQNAIDFFEAPQKLYSLFDSAATKWFLDDGEEGGFFKKLLSTGSSKVLSSLQILTGKEFVDELRTFFQLAQGWQERLTDRMKSVQRIFSSESTSFVLVTSFDEAKLLEAKGFEKTLKLKGYRTEALVVNKAIPPWQEEGKEATAEAEVLKEKMLSFYSQRAKQLDQYESESKYRVSLRSPELFDEIQGIDDLFLLVEGTEVKRLLS